ncbi:hypothetical protein Hypma_005651 [Hypsizygus marmoreus]|uniref:F-box domain-containing protein n=1 Tax=Hypsizygus marmoreus TaxID=39966 RepID=A0A369K479_HYPMA|nr:hypothetical protein Hypma_005651 [Hypsizygus marmoreus]
MSREQLLDRQSSSQLALARQIVNVEAPKLPASSVQALNDISIRDGSLGRIVVHHEDHRYQQHLKRRMKQILRSAPYRARITAMLGRSMASSLASSYLGTAHVLANMRDLRRCRFWLPSTLMKESVQHAADGVPAVSALPQTMIQDLPEEIIQEILLMSMGEEIAKPGPANAPYNVMRVCRQWNRIAVGTAGMWRELYVQWDFDASLRMKRCKNAKRISRKDEKTATRDVPMNIGEMLPRYLDRAKDDPLAIVYDFRSMFRPTDILSTSLQPYFRHIAILRLSMPASFFEELAHIARGEHGLFPALTLVAFEMPYADGVSKRRVGSTGRNTISFKGSRKLVDVSMNSASPKFSFIGSNLVSGLPLRQLTDLMIFETSLHANRALAILKKSTNLQVCNMFIQQWVDDRVPPAPLPVLFRNLKVLILQFSGAYNYGRISPFFDVLTTPALQNLKVVAPYAFDLHIIPSLVAMQERSRASLLQLTLSDVVFNDCDLIYLLSILPALQYLMLQAPLDGACHSYIHILRHIAYRLSSEDQVILPNLTEISITDNLPDSLLDEHSGKVLDRHARRGLSVLLQDESVLKSLASRWWPNENPPLKAADGRLKRLQRATVLWRNVPKELAGKERVGVRIADEMGFMVDLPLEVRSDGL